MKQIIIVIASLILLSCNNDYPFDCDIECGTVIAIGDNWIRVDNECTGGSSIFNVEDSNEYKLKQQYCK